ncbi:uncharacterized protein BT62DRAFT_1007205 [Guyanagaster necrorhizus]|uniref:Uncharacterized protein n=1 Tax=Guyanagaster necrorhizus TaxID=856835 RepID=A0A9P7VSW5_9AGAR|nr:uncharacterized protein BT62DRAFT_1007205 [Guyanagaster necrorhizus MCA 3950]KAG7445454.1 hypothetical protein BT62DRAFT_1007205 [Guyanagaster necrorhizus MCA 3950]
MAKISLRLGIHKCGLGLVSLKIAQGFFITGLIQTFRRHQSRLGIRPSQLRRKTLAIPAVRLCIDEQGWQHLRFAARKDKLVDDSIVKFKRFHVLQRLGLNKASVLLNSIDDAFLVSFPKRTVNIHFREKCRMKMIVEEMPWVERLAGPGDERTFDFVGLRMEKTDHLERWHGLPFPIPSLGPSDTVPPHLWVIRIFTDKGEHDFGSTQNNAHKISSSVFNERRLRSTPLRSHHSSHLRDVVLYQRKESTFPIQKLSYDVRRHFEETLIIPSFEYGVGIE